MTFSEMKEYEEKARNARSIAYRNVRELSGTIYDFVRCNTRMTEEEYKKMQKAYAELGVALVDAKKCNEAIEDLNSGEYCCDVLPTIPDVKEIMTEDEYM